MEVMKQPGDGHCIIHSVRASLSMSRIAAVPSYEGLLQMVRFEILNNLAYYKEFVNEADQENADIEADVNRYIHEKAYGNDTMDLIIWALANCLCVELRIFERTGQQFTLYTVPITPARRGVPARAVLDILHTPEHYDALIDVRNSDTDQEWKTVGSAKNGQQNRKRKRPFVATSTPTQTHTSTSNRYAGLTTDDENSEDCIDDIPDFTTFFTRVKKRRQKIRKSSSSATDTPSSDPYVSHWAKMEESEHEGKVHNSTEFNTHLSERSDRDRALINGTKKHFLIAKNLFCKKHVEDDMIRKFAAIRHLTGEVKNTIMKDIFGSETLQIKGLIDCLDENSFDELCYTLYQRWEGLERSCGESITPQFANYFKKYIEKDMRDGMILGNFFYNNQTESMNFRFKNKIREHKATSETSGKPAKKCTFSEAIKIYKGMLQIYERNAERAIIGVGPYILAPNYANFNIQINRWVQMSANARNRKTNLFNKASLDNPTEQQRDTTTAEPSISGANISGSQAQPNVSNFPGSLDPSQPNPTENEELFEFSRSGLSQNYKVDWNGARTIIANKDLMKSPWADDSYLVKSESNPHNPNSVSFSKARHSVKCSCPRFQYHSICKHAISVAFTEGFVRNLVKKWAPNLSRQMQPTVPPRTGQKRMKRGNESETLLNIEIFKAVGTT
eukprot:Seg1231.10 transcript_id=Seg1231.10/GoldUCD/mRNA.D3Y31 product="hypothetical protein" protein_id=Seg1231.10/GoldUCD/D3Y31